LGIDSDIAKFLENIASDYGFECKEEDRRENVLIEKFGLDISNTDIRNSLLPLIVHDLKVYDLVNIEVQERKFKKKCNQVLIAKHYIYSLLLLFMIKFLKY